MGALKFLGGLVAVVFLHVIGVRVVPGFSQMIDLFLLLALFNAVSGSLAGGLFGGLVAGLTCDALTGGLYGLHGTADTLTGYGTAFASQRLVIQRPAGVMLLFSLAAATQQGLLLALRLLLLSDPDVPQPSWLVAKIVAVGLMGPVGFLARGQFQRGLESWRRNRTARLR